MCQRKLKPLQIRETTLWQPCGGHERVTPLKKKYKKIIQNWKPGLVYKIVKIIDEPLRRFRGLLSA